MGLSAKELMKIGLRSYKESTPVNWHGKIINVKHILPLEDEANLSSRILKCCYDEDSESYVNGLVKLSIMANVVATYSDVVLPDNISDQHLLLYYSDLYKTVASGINQTQLSSIINTVNRCIYG